MSEEPRPHKRGDGWPTRADMLLWSPAERAIHEAVGVVEAAGASTALTEAVILLSKAQDLVADHVEGDGEKPRCVRPGNRAPKEDQGSCAGASGFLKPEDVALFDLDGTLANYEGALCRDMALLQSHGETHGTAENDVYMNDKLPYVAARMRLIKSQPGWWKRLEKLAAGYDVLHAAKQAGFSIHVLTKGPSSNPAAWAEKLAWCRENVPGAAVTITEDKSLVYGKVLVDDFPDYMDRWLKWRPRGLGIMPARACNEGYSHPNVIRYDGSNLGEVAERLDDAKKRGAS